MHALEQENEEKRGQEKVDRCCDNTVGGLTVYVRLRWTCIHRWVSAVQSLIGVKHVSIFSDEPAVVSLAQFGLAAVTFQRFPWELARWLNA